MRLNIHYAGREARLPNLLPAAAAIAVVVELPHYYCNELGPK